MRITNSMTINSFLRNLYNNNKLYNKYGMQLSSNKRIIRISDDPIGTLKAIQTRKNISVKNQYQKNIENAKTVLTQTENALAELNSIFQRMIELVGSSSTDIYTETERISVAKEVSQLKEALVNIGNSSLGGKYIFGGYNTTTTPFKVDSTGALLYNGIDICANNPSDSAAIQNEKNQTIRYEIDVGIDFNVFINGIELMGVGDDNLYKILDDFINVLEDPASTVDDIVAFKTRIKNAHEHVLDLTTEVGSRTARLELVEQRFIDDLICLEDIRTKIEDVDQAETMTKMSMAQSIYQATLAVGARLIQPTLLNFLK